MKPFIQVMKALSDPNRVMVIKMLQERPLCVCEIREALDLAQPTVSKHLQKLEEAGLVTSKKEGLWVIYQLGDGSVSPFAANLLGNLRHWLGEEPQIRELIRKKLPLIKREHICKQNSPVRRSRT